MGVGVRMALATGVRVMEGSVMGPGRAQKDASPVPFG